MPTREVFQQIQQDDVRGWESLYESFPFFVGLLTRRGIPLEDAQDIVQDRYVKLWEVRGRLDVKDHPSSFLWNMVQNRGTDFLRRGINHSISLTDFEKDERTEQYVNDRVLIDHSQLTPEDEVVMKMEVEQVLGGLPPAQREVALLVGEGYPHSAIAEKLHAPMGTVKTRLRLVQSKARNMRESA